MRVIIAKNQRKVGYVLFTRLCSRVYSLLQGDATSSALTKVATTSTSSSSSSSPNYILVSFPAKLFQQVPPSQLTQGRTTSLSFLCFSYTSWTTTQVMSCLRSSHSYSYKSDMFQVIRTTVLFTPDFVYLFLST